MPEKKETCPKCGAPLVLFADIDRCSAKTGCGYARVLYSDTIIPKEFEGDVVSVFGEVV